MALRIKVNQKLLPFLVRMGIRVFVASVRHELAVALDAITLTRHLHSSDFLLELCIQIPHLTIALLPLLTRLALVRYHTNRNIDWLCYGGIGLYNNRWRTDCV